MRDQSSRYRVLNALAAVLPQPVARWLMLCLRFMLSTAGGVLVIAGWALLVFSAAYLLPTNHHPVLTPLALVGLPAGIMLVKLTRRLRDALASLAVTPQLAGRTIVFLRAFDDDGFVSENTGERSDTPLFWWIGKVRLSPEQELARAAPLTTPLLAVGRPGEMLPPGGALRVYFGDDTWVAGVAELLKNAELVIMQVGEGRGISTEVEMVLKAIPPERFVLFNPDPEAFASVYTGFRTNAAHLFPHSLPEDWLKWHAPFMLFDPEWKPLPMPDVAVRPGYSGALGFLLRALSFLYGSGRHLTAQDRRLRAQMISRGDYRDSLQWLSARAAGRTLERFEVISTTTRGKKNREGRQG